MVNKMIEGKIDDLITQYKYRVSLCDKNLDTYMKEMQRTLKECGAFRYERGKALDRLTRDMEVCETKRNVFDYFVRELTELKNLGEERWDS